MYTTDKKTRSTLTPMPLTHCDSRHTATAAQHNTQASKEQDQDLTTTRATVQHGDSNGKETVGAGGDRC